eukprot:TRINITY_DN382_c1_g1_i1.p1 TRINITY_DN382_c1_g1~~TRINITY_DN382_c1_g1_i1.p1  ORF type:complete len:304 (+),score=72.59 TRINITY_DN382_c1_g1_i1:92-1003(+)
MVTLESRHLAGLAVLAGAGILYSVSWHREYRSMTAPGPAAEDNFAWLPQTKSVPCADEALRNAVNMVNVQSQDQEDSYLLYRFFQGRCAGRYMEMGALDGVLYSNTYAWEKTYGWTGLLAEADPDDAANIRKKRSPENQIFNAAVCSTEGTVHFMLPKAGRAVRGIWEFATPGWRQRWWPGMDINSEGHKLECKPMDSLLRDAYPDEEQVYIDFWSLDIEGAEIQALQTVDWSRTQFGVIFSERSGEGPHDPNDVKKGSSTGQGSKNTAVRTFLERRGYIYFSGDLRSDWFVNPRFNEIYSFN